MELFLDQRLLRNTLLNLISNALKYSDAGKNIYITEELNAEMLSITIRDEGIGIPEKDQVHLFLVFLEPVMRVIFKVLD